MKLMKRPKKSIPFFPCKFISLILKKDVRGLARLQHVKTGECCGMKFRNFIAFSSHKIRVCMCNSRAACSYFTFSGILSCGNETGRISGQVLE